MTKKQLLPLLINHYENAINEVSKTRNLPQIEKKLIELKVNKGICNCAHHKFNVEICHRKWVYKHQRWDGYWYTSPSDAFFKQDIIKALQFRVDKMKEILLND